MKAEWRAWLDELSATFKALWRLAAGPPALEVPHEALLERTEAAVAALHPRTMRLRLVEVVPETPSVIVRKIPASVRPRTQSWVRSGPRTPRASVP